MFEILNESNMNRILEFVNESNMKRILEFSNQIISYLFIYISSVYVYMYVCMYICMYVCMINKLFIQTKQNKF